MKALLFALSFFLLAFRSPAQVRGLKEQALESFRRERYDEAVALMERAAEADPTDAESWYYLGFFNHYRAYDSRPLKGYDLSYSERVFSYLDRALELDPSLGDARYFYGAECSANAFHAMRERDLERLRHFYEKAFLKGAYPPWLLELGRNMLDGCDRDAILFAGGNGDFDVCSYLQLHEGYRRDVSVLPVGYTDRPWYAGYLRDGSKGRSVLCSFAVGRADSRDAPVQMGYARGPHTCVGSSARGVSLPRMPFWHGPSRPISLPSG
ncbi:MAG: tetratricopeptide repeat protein [Alistipes ihumii]